MEKINKIEFQEHQQNIADCNDDQEEQFFSKHYIPPKVKMDIYYEIIKSKLFFVENKC